MPCEVGHKGNKLQSMPTSHGIKPSLSMPTSHGIKPGQSMPTSHGIKPGQSMQGGSVGDQIMDLNSYTSNEIPILMVIIRTKSR
jgi:hypothetical protein